MSKKEEVKDRLRKYIESGNSISYKEIKKNEPTLLYDIYRYLGNIESACNEIGVSSEEMKIRYGFHVKQKPISEEELISRLNFLYSIGELKTKNLGASGGYFDDNQAINILRRKFGSIDNGLEYYGLENQYKVTHKKIERKLRYYSDKGYTLSFTEMRKVDPKLVDAVRSRFSSYYEGLDYYGVKYTRKYNVISRENIKERLKDIKEEFGTINYSITKRSDPTVLHYSYENFNSFDEMLNEFGYSEYVEPHPDILVQSGWEFEKICCEILDILDIEYKFNKSAGKYRPDFQLKNGVWMDSKLSIWTPTIQKTIDNYSPQCEKLIIVYMRGDEDMLRYYTLHKNTEIISVKELINRLPDDDRNSIEDKIKSIENDISNIRTVTTKRRTHTV